MKDITKFCNIFFIAMLISCCTTNELEIDDQIQNEGTDNTQGGGQATSDTSGDNLETFDVVLDKSSLEEGQETIPTDKSAETYDDYVENSSFTSKIIITYTDGDATLSGDVSLVTITKSGAHVVVKSTAKEMEYQIKGTSTNGSLKIYSDNKFKLLFDGISLTNPTGAAINIQSKKRIFVVSQTGTTNSFTDGKSYTTTDGEDMKGCIFAEGQMVFSGSGSINVTANYKHGICSDDYIRVRKGTNIYITSNVGNGFKANDYMAIDGGVLNIDIKGDTSKGISSDGYVQINGGRTMILTSGAAKFEDDDVTGCAGVKSDSIFVMNGGTLGVKSTGSGGKGISSDIDITINNGTIEIITTGKQYVYGNYDTSAKGIKSDANITINGGNILVKTTGGEGSEGIESKNIMTINGGTIGVSAYDDAFNASKNITITGGKVYAYASGNDGIDSNGTINISGGVIVSSGTATPEEGIDCDQNTFTITGGTIIGVGGASSTPTSSQCKQPVIIYGGTGTSGTYLSLADSKGNNVLAYKIPRNYSQMTILISSPSLSQNSSYTLSSGGTLSGGTGYHGLFIGSTYSGGTSLANLSLTNIVTTAGNTQQGGGMPGVGMPGWGR